jgi:hypothetical protein
MSIDIESAGKSKGCNDQLNVQLQILDARLKQAENQVAILGKGLAEVAGGLTNAPTGLIGIGFKAMCSQQGQVFSGAYAALLKTVPTDLTSFMSGMLIQLALQQLGTATISASEISSAVANLNSQFDGLKNELAVLDPINDAVAYAAKQAQINVVLQAFASASTMMTAVNNLSQCKSTALKLG